MSVEAGWAAVVVWGCVSNSDSRVGRWLDARPLALVGVLSYSLYLWQQPFMNPYNPSAWFCRWPLNLVLAVGCALLSYRLIERPFLRRKARLSR
jgi:peptidoglycan/LPS O-acetylase OafA/YrhL